MSEAKKEDNTSILALLAIFVGMYIFLFGFIKNRATSTVTVFFGGLSVFFLELFGAVVAYDQLNKVRNPDLVGMYPMFYIFLFFYVMLVIRAFREQYLYNKESRDSFAALLVEEAMEQARLREQEEKRLQAAEESRVAFHNTMQACRDRMEALGKPAVKEPYQPWEDNTTSTMPGNIH